MDELVALLLSVQGRIEDVIGQLESGALSVPRVENYLELLRGQRDDLDKAIALARNPQRKAY
ncbi:MAG TPA: hypothetical protein VGO37_00630 [Steroidobacteraceae bacterium]|jgi:hypothetical protein|nr:hypothetical protein [Steroidobacteraceae bacterium]